MPVENDVSRPSTMESYTTLEEIRGPDCEENEAIELGDKEEIVGKQRTARMPQLPPEIRETYVYFYPPEGLEDRFRLLVIPIIDAFTVQNTLPHRPRNLRLARSRRSSLARGLANAPSLRSPPLKMSIFLSIT